MLYENTQSSAVRGWPSCQVRFGLSLQVVVMWPSGVTVQVSVLSCGIASARYGCGTSRSSLKVSHALNTRAIVARKLPLPTANGFIARLAGSPREARTIVGCGAGAAGTAGCAAPPPGEAGALVAGAHAAIPSARARPSVR